MIITCEQCSTRFQLDDARIPEEGVRVRCSRCKHSFFAKRVADAGDPLENAVARALREHGVDPADTSPEVDAAGVAAGGGAFAERPAAGGADDSDWEFNREPDAAPHGPNAEPGVDAAGEVVDALLTPSSVSSPDDIDDLFDTGGYVDDDIDDLLGSGSDPAQASSPPDAAPALEQDVGLAGEAECADVVQIADAADLAAAPDSPAVASAAPEPPGAQASADGEQLGSPEDWSFLADEADAAAEPSDSGRVVVGPRSASTPISAAPQLRPPIEVDLEPTKAGLWLGRVAQGLGWVGMLLLVGWILQIGLWPAAPVSGAASATQRVAGLEARQVRGRWLDNAVAGPIFVVSGALYSAGPKSVVAQARLAVRLYDKSGVPVAHRLGSVGPPLPQAWLRERDPAVLQDRQDQAALSLVRVPFWPDRSRPFQAVLGRLPEAAQRFELVAVPLEEPAPGPGPRAAPARPQRS